MADTKRARGPDPKTLLTEEAAELLATGPRHGARALVYVLGLLLVSALAAAVLVPIERTVVATGYLAPENSASILVVKAHVPVGEAKRLKVDQRAHVRLGTRETIAASPGAVLRVEGPVRDDDLGLAFVLYVSLDDQTFGGLADKRVWLQGLGATVEVATGETTPLGWFLERTRKQN
jgi:hypothetical protein